MRSAAVRGGGSGHASRIIRVEADDYHALAAVHPDAEGRWELERDPYLLESGRSGRLRVGDVRFGPVKRVAAAVGEDSMAIAFVHQYLKHPETLVDQ